MGFSERHMRPGGVAPVGDWRVKQYLVTIAKGVMDDAVAHAAASFLPKLLPSSAATGPQLAFSVLHKGMDAVWLNLYAWVYGEILHCRAASAPLDSPTAFTPLSEPLIGCVWELPALVHERSAWVRHGLQPPSPDVEAYLDDFLPEGPVGAP